MEGKKRVIPGEVCTQSPERGNRSREATLNRAEVSRGHSSGNVKGRISRSSNYNRERENEQRGAENIRIDGFLQGDSAERKGPVRAHRSFNRNGRKGTVKKFTSTTETAVYRTVRTVV